ncbi:phosphorylase family protein [Hymenobacter ruricola]|uniref:5'-methylthioadenosine/S-adenosylhomocysteine nucleosidase n=1 Tax=Hymenobacter ruricola TaxID=2791023 RepID=A0ABS0IA01_9BACT|nr:effector-associated domain EAD1-containing protein [Hymenobacter ruricola]MBF9223778.1 5'-methylthioadenosine/S-adenosylhomocysteine nucleosidase [Hymenobacter ruricola]
MNDRTVLLLTALEGPERQVLLAQLPPSNIVHHPNTHTDYYVTQLTTASGEVRVVLGRTDQTNVNASLETGQALTYFQPHYAFFVGVAGGLKDVNIGDLVIGDDVYGYERGKATDNGFSARPGVGASSYQLERAATAFSQSTEWRTIAARLPTAAFPNPVQVYTGTIASGEKVDASVESELHQFLRVHCGHALAIEMEGYGFLKAARQHPATQALLLRGISDLVEDKQGADRRGSQPYACANAAAFVIAFVQQLYAVSAPPRLPTADEARRLAELASELYAGGIRDADIWNRAGGRIADIAVGSTGRMQWLDAARHLRNGGRGITFGQLLAEMLEDHPGNQDLTELRVRYESESGSKFS